MIEKLFYQDAYIKDFKARVIKQAQDSEGAWYVVLDQTAFYPTGGGQPFDTGSIKGVQVVNVEEVDGEVRHYLEGAFQDLEEEVSGSIDWERRFDHMQQHSGQHILSAAFDHLFTYRTNGFHLGTEILTIDIETESLSEEEAAEAERLANLIIIENRPIETKWVTEEELSQYPLRKETKVKEDIRLVIIPEFDYNGCGGTHPRATGEVQAIKILNWERQKKKTRVSFVCGGRVLKQLGDKQKVLLSLTKLLNAPEKEMEQAVLRILDHGKSLEKELEKAGEELLRFEAMKILDMWRENPIVQESFENRTIQELQKLARFIVAEANEKMVFLLSKNDGRLQLVCARGAARSENMKTILGQAMALINGKGGGNESFAQGGGETLIGPEEMMKQLIEMVK